MALVSSTQEEILHSTKEGVESARGGLEVKGAGITQAIEFQTLKRIANASSVIEDAADELEDKDVVDHEPDPDWTARYFGHVQDVSSEDLRRIWASILTSEIKSPGQTSLRTLDVLRNMTKTDAELFADICPFVLRGDWIYRDDSTRSIPALNFTKLLQLQDCGLLDVASNLRVTLEVGSDGYTIMMQRNADLLISCDGEPSSGIISAPAYRLTSAGIELYEIVENELNSDYLRYFASFLDRQSYNLYCLTGVVRNPDGFSITYSGSTKIDPFNSD